MGVLSSLLRWKGALYEIIYENSYENSSARKHTWPVHVLHDLCAGAVFQCVLNLKRGLQVRVLYG